MISAVTYYKHQKGKPNTYALCERKAELTDRMTRQMWVFAKRVNEIFDKKMMDPADDGFLDESEMVDLMAVFSAFTCCERIFERYHFRIRLNEVDTDFPSSFFKKEKTKVRQFMDRERPPDQDNHFNNFQRYKLTYLKPQFALLYLTFLRFKSLREQKLIDMPHKSTEAAKSEEIRMLTLMMTAISGKFVCSSSASQPDTVYASMLLIMSRKYYFEHRDTWTQEEQEEMYKHQITLEEFRRGKFLTPPECITSWTYRGVHPTKRASLKRTPFEKSNGTIHQQPAGEVPFKDQYEWLEFLFEMDRKRGNRPDDIPGFMTEEADAQLRKYDHNIPYLQTVIYNLPKAPKQFYPIAGEEVQDNDSDAGVTDSVKKNNKSDSRNARDKGQRRILQWLSPSKQEPSCSGTGRQNKRPEFRDSIQVKIISRTGKYVNIFPLIAQDIPEDPSEINGAIINTSKQLLDVKLAEEDVLEKSALAQLLHAFYTEDEGKKRRTAIESKFLQPSSPSKAHNTKVTTLNVSYGGSDDYRTVHVSDRTLVGTIRFPYDFRGGAEKLVDDYARNRMFADLKLRYTEPVSILPVVDAVPREKNADGTPTPKRPKESDENRMGICKGFALFSDHGPSFRLSPLSVEEFLLSASDQDLNDFFQVILAFRILNFRNACLDAIQVVVKEDDNDSSSESSSDEDKSAAARNNATKNQLMFMAGEGNMCDLDCVSFKDDFMFAFIGQSDLGVFKTIAFKNLITGSISEELNNHLTRKMASMQLPLQQFIGDVRKSLTCTSVSESFSRLTSFSIRRSILNEILFTCTVPFVLIERLAVTPASLKSNRTVAMVYKLWIDMLKNPKATRDSKKNKKDKMQTKKKRVGRKEVKTPSTVSDSD